MDGMDLSHLTTAERAHIEAVMMRQRQEEEKENEIMRKKHEEVIILEDKIRQRSEIQKRTGIELESTCHICLKTKFADGVGHICNYCNIRCCARCGGKVTLRSNKVTWVCILCRKKQELLSKTGQWIQKSQNQDGFFRRIEPDGSSSITESQDMFDKRPKLERTRSAAEKENVPIRAGSLQRQYSHQEPSRRLQFSDQQDIYYLPSSSSPVTYGLDEDISFYQGEIDGLMRQHPHLLHPKQHQHSMNNQLNSRALPKQPTTNTQSNLNSRRQLPAIQHSRNQERSFSGEEYSNKFYNSLEYDSNKIEIHRDKPSVLITSPGSPDLHSIGKPLNVSTNSGRYGHRLDSNSGMQLPIQSATPVEGRMQLKLGYDKSTLQLHITIICCTGLSSRANGAARNPFVKVNIVPDIDNRLRRKTKTISNTFEPRWGQIFIFDGMRFDSTPKFLKLTLWDYIRCGSNDFLGEVIVDLTQHALDDETEWYPLQDRKDYVHIFHKCDNNELDFIVTPTEYLSPPSTTSRLSDSDTLSEFEGEGVIIGRDGTSISSLGSSSSEVDFHERRSRRDMSPQGRKRVAGMVSRDYRTVSGIGQSYHNQQTSISSSTNYRRVGNDPTLGQRSQSATPSDIQRLGGSYISVNKSRRGSLSPQDDFYETSDYSITSLSAYNSNSRFQSRSATATPTGSPKKRQLPQIPTNKPNTMRDRRGQDIDERSGGRFIARNGRSRLTHHQATYRSTGGGGWERYYTGSSDSDLHAMDTRMRSRQSLSPDKDFMGEFGDSDMESVISITSSALSTQSERPRVSLGLGNASNLNDFEITPKLLHNTSTSSPSLSQTCIGCTHNTSNSLGQHKYKCTCKSSFESQVSESISLNKVNMLKNNLSEDILCRSIPISGKRQPISILKKPRYSVSAKRKHFYSQSRSLDYEDLKFFKTHRKIRYEDEIYGFQKSKKISKLSAKCYSEGNIFPKHPNDEIDQSHYLVMEDKVVSIGYDSDVGWLRKSEAHVPKFSKSLDEYIEAQKLGNLNRGSLSLELTRTTAEKLHSNMNIYGQKRKRRTLPQPPILSNTQNEASGFTSFVMSPFVDRIENKICSVENTEVKKIVLSTEVEKIDQIEKPDAKPVVSIEDNKLKIEPIRPAEEPKSEKSNETEVKSMKNDKKPENKTEIKISKSEVNTAKTENKVNIEEKKVSKEEVKKEPDKMNISEDVFDDDDLFDLGDLITNDKSSSNINGSGGKTEGSITNVVSDSSNSNHGVANPSTSSLKHTNQTQSLNSSSEYDARNRIVKAASKDGNNCRTSGPNNKTSSRMTKSDMNYSDFIETSSDRGDSFNRSQSNADGTPNEDKLGE
ncbi:unc-10 family protein [Megaselia abdita]